MAVTREEKIYRSSIEKRLEAIEGQLVGVVVEETVGEVSRKRRLATFEDGKLTPGDRTGAGLERIIKLEEESREHELELYGNGGPGLTRRIEKLELQAKDHKKDVERIEEAHQILFGEIWWIRKGMLLVLILVLLDLFGMWYRFGW